MVGPWWCVFTACLVYAAGLGMRIWELPAWNLEGFRLPGERLLATNDAYYYLAAAVGASFETAYSEFVALTRVLQAMTGLDYTVLAFWLPAFAAPLVVFPLAVAAWREGFPEAVLPAGLVAVCGGEYLVRTRLGFYDHDMLSLFLPLCFAAGLLTALSGHASRTWRFWKPTREKVLTLRDEMFFFSGCLGLGALGWSYLAFYPSGLYLVLGLWAAAMGLALLFATDTQRRLMLGLGFAGVLPLSAQPSFGMPIFAALLGIYCCRTRWLTHPKAFWVLTGLAALAVPLFVDIAGTWHWMHSKLAYQLNPDMLAQAGQLVLPTFLQSVAEVQPVPWVRLGFHMVGSSWVFALGVAGYILACWQHPRFLIFLPFLIAGAAGVAMGVRFTMYGGVVVGLGLGVGLALVLRWFGLTSPSRFILLGLFSLILLWPLSAFRAQLHPKPYITPEFAQAMTELQGIAPPDARIWVWWDMGFPAQYYSRRAAFADGHRQEHVLLYPLGLTHMTTSALQAAQIMKMATANQGAFTASAEAYDTTRTLWAAYRNNPLRPLQGLAPEQVQTLIENLAGLPEKWPDNLREQYFALHWDTIDASYYITLFGTWNVTTQSGIEPETKLRFAAVDSLDLGRGVVSLFGHTLRLDSLLEVGAAGRRSMAWENNSGLHGVYNLDAGTGYIMDQRLFSSMMVQMLIADPSLFDGWFELVMDKGPTMRVYRLR